MKAVVFDHYGPPEVLKLKDVAKPEPKANEVLVKIKASAVNSADIRVRGLAVGGFMRIVMRVVLGIRGPRKNILGVVLSGVIEQVGEEVTAFKKGDKVFAATGFKFGAYAEYTTIPEKSTIAHMPKKATFEQAAALPFGGTTSLYFLKKAGIGSKPKQNVLIYGSSGAVGTAAVQIAKHYGATVSVVCSTEGIPLAKSLKADHIIDYTKEDVTKNGKHYDIIFDAIGKQTKKAFARSLTENGRYVTVGGLDVAAEKKEQLEFLAELFDKGEYKAVIDKTYPLEQIVKAHTYAETWKKKGNIVITVGK